MIIERVTPDWIEDLGQEEIFVFGSNEAGVHGGGAARMAHDSFGAKWGQGVGRAGKTYAIPTKDKNIETLPIEKIKPYVDEFIDHAKANGGKTFLVTKIGCGLAGLTPEQVAPLFKRIIKEDIRNVYLPAKFLAQIG